MIQFAKILISISMMCSVVTSSSNSIPAKYCIMKNCYNCQKILTHGYPNEVHMNVCKIMLTQKNCCEFFTLQSRGILFWNHNRKNRLLLLFVGNTSQCTGEPFSASNKLNENGFLGIILSSNLEAQNVCFMIVRMRITAKSIPIGLLC